MLVQITKEGSLHAQGQNGIDDGCVTIHFGKNAIYIGGIYSRINGRENKVEEPGKNGAGPVYQGLLDKLFI